MLVNKTSNQVKVVNLLHLNQSLTQLLMTFVLSLKLMIMISNQKKSLLKKKIHTISTMPK